MTNKEKSLPKEKGLPKQKRTEAIAWAAGKAGTNLIENDLEKRFRFISPKDIVLYTAGTLVQLEDAEAWNSRVQKAFPDFQVT